jgi:hypothetical protein
MPVPVTGIHDKTTITRGVAAAVPVALGDDGGTARPSAPQELAHHQGCSYFEGTDHAALPPVLHLAELQDPVQQALASHAAAALAALRMVHRHLMVVIAATETL